ARPEGVEHYRPAQLVADVLAIADWLGGHRFHLVGHDWGGAVAWGLAGHHPDRLRTLTVVSTPHPYALREARHAEDDDQRERMSYVDLFRMPGKAEATMLEDDGMRLRTMLAGAGPDDAIEEYVRVMREPGALTAALNWYRAMEPGLIGVMFLVLTAAGGMVAPDDSTSRTDVIVANLEVGTIYLAAAMLLGLNHLRRRFRPIAQWLTSEQPASDDERRVVLTQPLRQ